MSILSIVSNVILVSLFVASVMLPALSIALMPTVWVLPCVRPVNVLLSCQSPLSSLYWYFAMPESASVVLPVTVMLFVVALVLKLNAFGNVVSIFVMSVLFVPSV